MFLFVHLGRMGLSVGFRFRLLVIALLGEVQVSSSLLRNRVGASEKAMVAAPPPVYRSVCLNRPPSPPPTIRALHDSLMVVKRMLESNVLVAGGGAVETALSIYLESFATTLGSREQLAIAEFAEALLVIPKTLAVNAAQVILWQRYYMYHGSMFLLQLLSLWSMLGNGSGLLVPFFASHLDCVCSSSPKGPWPLTPRR